MRVMVIVKADKDSEAGVLPGTELFEEMGKFNEELAKAGILLAAEGLHPTSKGARVKFSAKKFWLWRVRSMAEAIEWLQRAPFGAGAEVEIRRVYETADFGAAFTPELREQEERLRKHMLH
jgi:hypothetical protein